MSSPIVHDTAASRFSLQRDGHEAELTYRLQGATLVIEHTVVPGPLGGQGIGGDLVKAALEHARAAGLKVVPACSYAAAYVQRHPEYADLVDG